MTLLATFVGCMETRRSLGEDCLKDQDCLSGTCLQLHCAAAQPTTDARAMTEAEAQTSSEPPVDAALDSSGAAD
jgi:hypothetical protein